MRLLLPPPLRDLRQSRSLFPAPLTQPALTHGPLHRRSHSSPKLCSMSALSPAAAPLRVPCCSTNQTHRAALQQGT